MFIRGSALLPLVAATIACGSFSSPVHAFAMNGRGWGPIMQATNTHTQTCLSATIDETVETARVKTANILSLDSIRSTLIRQEETIIFAIIERAQYRQNSIVYEHGGFGDLGVPLGSTPEYIQSREESLSFLEYILMGTVS